MPVSSLLVTVTFSIVPSTAAAAALRNCFEARARVFGREEDVWICRELTGEIRHTHAKRRRPVVCAAGTLTRALRAVYVVIGEGYVGTVIGIERHLEVVGKITVGPATEPAGRHRTEVNDVIAHCVLRERRIQDIAVHRLCCIDLPLCPTVVCAGVRARAG